MTSGTAPLKPLNEHLDTGTDEESALSAALVTIFRGKFCNTLLPGRNPVRFKAGDVLYDIGDLNRTLFFLQGGYVKIGTVTPDGREIIYDVRKAGDVVGELCVVRIPRGDRAIALESGEAIQVSYAEILSTLVSHPNLLAKVVEIFCGCLADAYDQIITLTGHDLIGRVVQVLLSLAVKLGNPDSDPVQIPAYLTQEEISQMVGARRERVSTALNSLRRRGLVNYSSRGHFVLHVAALHNLVA